MAEEYDKKRIYELLEERGIPYEKLEHEPVFTIEEMQKAGITERGGVCKNLFLRDAKGKQHFLVVVKEETRVDLRKLAEKIGSTKLSFGSAERLAKYLGVQQGSVSPLGVLNNQDHEVMVIFEQGLEGGKIGVHPNDNTATIWLEFADLEKIIKEAGNRTRRVVL